VCDRIDERHKAILSPRIWGDGKPAGVNERAAEEIANTARAAKLFGVKVVNGFTGSSIWPLLYSFPPVTPAMIDAGYREFADRWNPILDVFKEQKVRFALEAHPTEIAFDIASASDRPTRSGVFGGHLEFGHRDRNWDFRSIGRGRVDFEGIVRALNRVGYAGPLSVEWEDIGMDREFGAREACARVKAVDFPPSNVRFDAAFERDLG